MAEGKIQVEHLIAEPGTKVEGYLRVGEMQDGTPVRIPLAIINGSYPGRTLYIQAASDGNELNGVAVVQYILQKVDPSALHGAIIAVPLVNLLAFHHSQSHNPVDGRKMNRCFPGKPDGTHSERIAYRLYHSAIKKADLCIDLHQGGVGRMIDEVRVRIGKGNRCYEESLELARVFGLGYILDEKGPKGQLARVAPEDGIPTIDPELGGTHGWDIGSIRKGIRGVMNVLRYYGLLSGQPEIPSRQIVAHGFKEVMANRGGFLRVRAKLGAHHNPGDLIADVVDPFGNIIERITSPCEGILWSHKPYPMTSSGEVIATLGVDIGYI
jgi:hypothetical protein